MTDGEESKECHVIKRTRGALYFPIDGLSRHVRVVDEVTRSSSASPAAMHIAAVGVDVARPRASDIPHSDSPTIPDSHHSRS